jgi:kinesin family protein 15
MFGWIQWLYICVWTNIKVFKISPSGKTYTMEGVGGDLRGVIPRVAEQIIDHIENNARQVDNEGIDYSIHGSYLEIYQEQLCDLLNNGDDAVDLRIRMDPLSITGKELCVEGLTERLLKTSKDFLKLIQIGSKNRTLPKQI